ncbi:hypothetical protein FHT86_000880 [Rhizobium sp. BK313]|nr:hypothetical protein [Rhizobium sp. BK313]
MGRRHFALTPSGRHRTRGDLDKCGLQRKLARDVPVWMIIRNGRRRNMALS